MLVRRLRAVFAVLLAAVTLSACAPTVHLEPAADANNPQCAEVTVDLGNIPVLAGMPRLWTDAQSTGAWGEGSSAIILSCGVAVPAPTSELQCVTIEGVDWLVNTADSPYVRLTTYGRDPAVELYINTAQVTSNDVIATRSLVGAISNISAERECTTPDELDDEILDELQEND